MRYSSNTVRIALRNILDTTQKPSLASLDCVAFTTVTCVQVVDAHFQTSQIGLQLAAENLDRGDEVGFAAMRGSAESFPSSAAKPSR